MAPKGRTINQANQPKNKDMQGEGHYDAARRYDDATREFVEAGKVDDAARAAKPDSQAQAEAMKRAEEIGKSHAKGEDPALRPEGSAPKP